MPCGCQSRGYGMMGDKDNKPTTQLSRAPPSMWNDAMSSLQCMNCAIAGAIIGGLAFYFVPGANTGMTALSIGGAVFLGQVVGRFFTSSPTSQFGKLHIPMEPDSY